ncbi:MAG: DMT family transporter [Bacteroidota bacterium]
MPGATSSVPVRVYVILGIGLLAISSSPILVRLAAQTGEAPGLAIAVWRTNIAALLLAPVAFAQARTELRRLSRREVAYMTAAGFFLALHFILWIESLYHTSVASASVLVTLTPLFLAILGRLFLKEAITPRMGGAIALAIGGAMLIGLGDASGGSGSQPLLGNSLAVLAALLVSAYLIIGRVVRQGTSWLAYVFFLYALVALTTLGAAWARGVPLMGYAWPFYGYCALMAIGPQLLGHGSMNYAIKYLPAAFIGILTLLEPVVASVAAYFLFGEVPVWLALLGSAIVLSAIVFALWPRRG